MGTRSRVLKDGVPRRRAGVAVAMVALGLLTSLGCDDDRGVGWAQAAEDWVAEFDASWSTGATNAARFYSPDVHFDWAGLTGREGTSLAELAQFIREEPPNVPPDLDDLMVIRQDEPVYLSRTGLIHPVTLTADEPIPMAFAERIGPSGITQEVFARSPDGSTERTIATELVSGYVNAWASGQPRAIAALYAQDATLIDSIAGVKVEGREEIAGLAARSTALGSLAGATLRTLPDDRGPACYSNGSFDDRSTDVLVLLLDVGGDCPGQVAVELHRDAEGRIVGEERFHRIDAVGGCLPPDQLPHGWWESDTLAALPPVRRTSILEVRTHEIAVWNGSEQHEGLLRWALQRFADQGLPPPQPNSVSFLPDIADAWEAYGFVTGSNAPDIGVPLGDLETCVEPDCTWPAATKHAMLHELAHLWLTPSPYAGIPRRLPAGQSGRLWARTEGLAWDGPDLAWEQRAGERAAEVLAWGLMDQPSTVDARLGQLTCEELAADFRVLTHSTPDPRACAGPDDATGGHG